MHSGYIQDLVVSYLDVTEKCKWSCGVNHPTKHNALTVLLSTQLPNAAVHTWKKFSIMQFVIVKLLPSTNITDAPSLPPLFTKWTPSMQHPSIYELPSITLVCKHTCNDYQHPITPIRDCVSYITLKYSCKLVKLCRLYACIIPGPRIVILWLTLNVVVIEYVPAGKYNSPPAGVLFSAFCTALVSSVIPSPFAPGISTGGCLCG